MAADWRDLEIDEIPEWSVKAQSVLLASLSMLLIVGAVFFLVMPFNADLAQAKQQEALLKSQFRMKAEQVAALPNVDEQLQNLQAFYRRLTEQLPEAGELAQLLAGINDTGLQYHLDFERLNWQTGEQVGWLYQVPLDIELIGSYQNVGFFSAALAKLSRIVALQDFTLERVSDDGELLRFIVTAHTYRYVEADAKEKSEATGEAS